MALNEVNLGPGSRIRYIKKGREATNKRPVKRNAVKTDVRTQDQLDDGKHTKEDRERTNVVDISVVIALQRHVIAVGLQSLPTLLNDVARRGLERVPLVYGWASGAAGAGKTGRRFESTENAQAVVFPPARTKCSKITSLRNKNPFLAGRINFVATICQSDDLRPRTRATQVLNCNGPRRESVQRIVLRSAKHRCAQKDLPRFRGSAPRRAESVEYSSRQSRTWNNSEMLEVVRYQDPEDE
ncbi:hypothetical protein DFH09DRAFT_1106523 [Mycena vulgaris]|nr:hypothetical protein DFH09DRAFT_1106523 [Mycena vulgaris]